MSKEKQIEEIKLLLESTCDNTECNLPFNCDLCQATRLYNAGYRKQSEWISVEERLPEDDLSEEHKKKTIKVLVAIKAKNGITIRTQERFLDYTYSNGGERKTYWTWRFSRGEVTHWMPLPEPPKKGGAE